MNKAVIAFVAGLLIMAGGLWFISQRGHNPFAPKDEPGPIVEHGPFSRKETIAVGEVLNGIHQLNRLLVFQAYVTAQTTTHDIGWLTQTDQTMLTPAFVNYYINLDSIDERQVKVDGNDIYVTRPPVMIERPNIDTQNVRVFSDGIWSVLSAETETLRVKNNKMAINQLVARAKMPFLVQAATRAAAAAEESNIRKALSAAGHKNIIVHVGDQG